MQIKRQHLASAPHHYSQKKWANTLHKTQNSHPKISFFLRWIKKRNCMLSLNMCKRLVPIF